MRLLIGANPPEPQQDIRQIIDSFSEKLTQARSDLVDAKEEALTLREKAINLEERIRKLTAKERYLLVQTESGGTCYAMKSPSTEVEKSARYCSSCLSNGEELILQPNPFRVNAPSPPKKSPGGHGLAAFKAEYRVKVVLPEGMPDFEYMCPKCHTQC